MIHLLTELPVGDAHFEIAANDNLGNASTTTVTFEVIVTPESIKEDVRYFLSVGDIKNKGLANSLLAKLNAAARAIERDQCPTAINIYNAFIHELNAQSGKGVDPTAAAIMIADAEYLIANCDRFVPGAIQAAPAAAMVDFTKDGVTNGADYAVWRKTQGHHVPKHSGADGDGDGLNRPRRLQRVAGSLRHDAASDGHWTLGSSGGDCGRSDFSGHRSLQQHSPNLWHPRSNP